jgi:hypothetical protein
MIDTTPKLKTKRTKYSIGVNSALCLQRDYMFDQGYATGLISDSTQCQTSDSDTD